MTRHVKRKSRPGLSRVEVLILLAAVLLLVGLLLPAIARIREEAARTSCANNLKSLAMGVNSYSGQFRERLPPLTDQGDRAATGTGLVSAFVTLQPYLEAGPRMYRGDKSPPANYHAHSSAPFTYTNKDGSLGTQHGGDANQVWTLFVDPADTTADRLRDVPMTLPDGTTGHYAAGSYAVNGLLPWGGGRFPQFPAGGWMVAVLFAERPQACRTASGDVVYNLWGVGFYGPEMPAFAALAPDPWTTGQVAPALPLPGEDGGPVAVRVGRRDAPPQAPDFPTPVQLIGRNQPCDPRLPGSPHRAGLQVALADGSVRVFAPDTSAWVFWSACLPPRPVGRAPDGQLP
jgi:hypothetical protein